MENTSLTYFIIWLATLIYPTSTQIKKENEYYIQPIGSVNNEVVTHVKSSIESFYGFKCVVLPKKDFHENLLSKSKKRYEAISILKYFKSDKNIIVVTNNDISIKKGKNNEYGIIGIGFCPGKTCMVSTFRIKSNKNLFIERLKKVTIHEVGHNLGLPHCDYDPNCLMNDAKGTVKQIDKEKILICDNCKNILKKNKSWE